MNYASTFHLFCDKSDLFIISLEFGGMILIVRMIFPRNKELRSKINGCMRHLRINDNTFFYTRLNLFAWDFGVPKMSGGKKVEFSPQIWYQDFLLKRDFLEPKNLIYLFLCFREMLWQFLCRLLLQWITH